MDPNRRESFFTADYTDGTDPSQYQSRHFEQEGRKGNAKNRAQAFVLRSSYDTFFSARQETSPYLNLSAIIRVIRG